MRSPIGYLIEQFTGIMDADYGGSRTNDPEASAEDLRISEHDQIVLMLKLRFRDEVLDIYHCACDTGNRRKPFDTDVVNCPSSLMDEENPSFPGGVSNVANRNPILPRTEQLIAGILKELVRPRDT
jgi:hypothetical protein